MKTVYISTVKPGVIKNKKRFLNLLVAFAFLMAAKLSAQCGPAPTATTSNAQCYGALVTTVINTNLLGGPYNIQAYIDYMNPGIPFAPYVTNYAGATYPIAGQTAGTYTVYVVDIGHGNCYDSAVYTITQPAILNFATGFQSPPTCTGLATASFTMAGGTAPYSIAYTQDSGLTFTTLTTTSATTYTTTLNLGPYAWLLTDANGCIVDQTSTVFGLAATDQAHWYEGICGVTDSSVEYLTAGNMTFNRSVNAWLLGLGDFNDHLILSVNYGDGSAVQNTFTTVKNSTTAIPVSHTYTATGVYKVTYTVTHAQASSGGMFGYNCWDLNMNSVNDPSEDINGDGNWDVLDCADDSVSVVEFINNNSDVWPGDANGDGVANNVDLLSVGIAFGTTDVVRPSASNAWVAQPCIDWATSFTSGLNYKHSDCDGNGTVGFSDTTAISANYGQTHVLKLAQNVQATVTDPVLAVNFPSGFYSLGSPVTIPITLGSNAVPANNFYGIAFTVNYPSNVIDPNSVSVDYSSCFMGTIGTNAVEVHKNISANSSVDVAVSLTNQTNMSGFGTLCSIGAITIDNVSGKMNTTQTEYFTISNVTFIDKDGNPLALNTQKDSVTINTAAGIQENKNSDLKLYPNPAKEIINLVSVVTIEEVQIMDLTGRTVQLFKGSSNSVQVNTENLESGFYIAHIKTAKGVEDRRVEIQK